MSCHPDDQQTNILGQACSGPGVVQMVALDCLATETQDLPGLPRLAFAIRHQGRLAWDLKWFPGINPEFVGTAPRLGH